MNMIYPEKAHFTVSEKNTCFQTFEWASSFIVCSSFFGNFTKKFSSQMHKTGPIKPTLIEDKYESTWNIFRRRVGAQQVLVNISLLLPCKGYTCFCSMDHFSGKLEEDKNSGTLFSL